MSWPLFISLLGRSRVGLVWWSISIIALNAYVVGFYPSIRDSDLYADLFEELPREITAFFLGGAVDLGTMQGYLSAELFSFMAPLLLTIYAILRSGRVLGAEERRGALDLIFATPLPRWRYAASAGSIVAVETFILGLVLFTTLAVGAWMIGESLSVELLAAATVMVTLFALFHAAVALGVTLAWGWNAHGSAIAAVVAVAGYLLSSTAELTKTLEPYRDVSPYWHALGYGPLHEGFEVWRAVGYIGAIVAIATAGAIRFSRRDIITVSD